MSDSRRLAAEILRQIITERAFFAEKRPLLDSLSERERAFANMLILTSLRRLCFIRHLLKQYIKKKIPQKFASAEFALINAVTELLFMDTPDYAALNSNVELIKRLSDRFFAGMANAVLRKISAAGAKAAEGAEDFVFPKDFYQILAQDYSAEQIKSFAREALKTPPLDITLKQGCRFNTNLQTFALPLSGIRLYNAGSVNSLDGYAQGNWWVQDYAASLAVKLLGNLKGKTALDLCAAPGGKTAQLIDAGAEVTALDISPSRLETLTKNLKRLNFAAEIICSDALEYLRTSQKQYDIILLDAPCSATGTFRRHPELIHNKTLADVQKLLPTQKQLLQAARSALKKDGLLLYCTCSLSKLEGEAQIADFLQTAPDFRLLPLQNSAVKDILTPEGFLRVLPDTLADHGGADGFFAALLKKEK